MTIYLRGHHLLCMLTYIGKGYTPLFVENYDRIARQLSLGAIITLVTGSDDICAPLLCEKDCHCHRASVTMRDQIALQEISALLGVYLQPGSQLTLNQQLLEKLRNAFREHKIRRACQGCEWAELCTNIAQNTAYQQVKIQCSAD